ncbi:Hypothetical protein I596_3788 [Dokdonella koreensis DS-123]|uniref:Uncharacterized protein n=1 Tax=Dokdonella koreensis DS-123 TaxID=1300342 RepID=A0A167HBE2_9GAMM|nr:Hypothetical protein I596_3788 [Dokdonella koreensis DS-123]
MVEGIDPRLHDFDVRAPGTGPGRGRQGEHQKTGQGRAEVSKAGRLAHGDNRCWAASRPG